MPTLTLASADAFALSESEDEAMLTLVDELEADALRVRREHLDDCKPDTKAWELLKTKNQLRVYKERCAGSITWKHGSEVATHSRVPLLMAQGTLPGTIDDYLYGHFVHDSLSLRVLRRNSKLHVGDCALLWPTEQASMTKPYRFAGVVWMLAKLPGMGLVKNRDALQFMRQRVAHTVDDKELGVISSVSITHPDFPDFSEHRVVRMSAATVTILRPINDHQLDCFVLHGFDTHGNITESYATSLAMSEMLAVQQLPELALEKKLQYSMRHKKRSHADDGKEAGGGDRGEKRKCGSCGKNAYPRLLSQNTCSLCTKPTCSECRVSKKLCIGGTSHKLTTHRFMFCQACVKQCQALSTELVAKNELEERDLMLIKRERNSAVLEV